MALRPSSLEKKVIFPIRARHCSLKERVFTGANIP